MAKIHYGQPFCTARASMKKRKNIVPEDSVSLAPLGRKIHIRVGKSGVPPILDDWSNQIIKEKREDHFWEQTHKKEIDNYLPPLLGYSWQTIGYEGWCRVFIPAYSILKFRFEREEFSLPVIKFGSNSQPVQG